MAAVTICSENTGAYIYAANVCVCGYIYIYIREGNGTPLQYSCLENPMDRGAWWITVYWVTKSWTWLSTCRCMCMHTHNISFMFLLYKFIRLRNFLIGFFFKTTNGFLMLLNDHSPSIKIVITFSTCMNMCRLSGLVFNLHSWDRPNLIMIHYLFIKMLYAEVSNFLCTHESAWPVTSLLLIFLAWFGQYNYISKQVGDCIFFFYYLQKWV